MTFGEMKAEVFRRLRESSESPVMWTETDIAVALNEGYMEISDESEWYEKWQVIDLLDNQPFYDVRTLLRHPFLRIGAAYNNQSSRWLIPTSAAELDKGDRRWQMRVEEPGYYFVRGLWWLQYFPYKGIESGTIKQYYKALPPVLEDDSDEPGFHESHHYALVEWALADLYAQDAEVDLAWSHFKQYVEYELKITGHTVNRLQVPLMHGHNEEA